MASTAPQPQTLRNGVARSAPLRPWLYRVLGAALLVLGLAQLAANLGMLAPEAARVVGGGWGVLALATGAALAANGRLRLYDRLPTFAVERGAVECAELRAQTHAADLQVRTFAGATQLAVGEFPSPQGPAVEAEGTRARLRLEPRLALPYVAGPWSVALAKGVAWELDLRSALGQMDLDLRDLSVAALRVDSAVGGVDLTLPAEGAAEISLRLGLGDLVVRVPEGVEARVQLAAGALASARVDERRFIQTAPGEWSTPLYTATARRCTLSVRMGAGDMRVE
jgi:hypothetical protein